MPQWLLSMLLSLGVSIVERLGIPYLEKEFPKLAPLLDEILAIIRGKGQSLPSDALKDCAHGYCSAVGEPSQLVHE